MEQEGWVNKIKLANGIFYISNHENYIQVRAVCIAFSLTIGCAIIVAIVRNLETKHVGARH